MGRRFWCAEAGIFVGLWFALMLFARSSLLRDPGTFWHVAAGERMLVSREVIRADPFSFTRAGEQWVAYQWLAECGMAAVHRIAGWDGLLLATVSILALIYTWVASRLLRARIHVLWAVVLLMLVLLAGSHQFHVRPLILTIGLFALTFGILVDVDAGRKRLGYLWWLVPLFVLWANLHGGVLAGIGTVGLAVAWWSAAWLFGGDSPVRGFSDAATAIAAAAASSLAVFVNPYGADLPVAWFTTLMIPLPELIEEHGRIALTEPVGWTAILLAAGYLTALIGTWPRRPRVTWLLPLVWLVLACERVRNVPLFGIAAVLALAEILPQTRWVAWLHRREILLPAGRANEGAVRNMAARNMAVRNMAVRSRKGRSICPWILPAVVIATATLALVAFPADKPRWAKFDPGLWPEELLVELHDIADGSPEPVLIFNDLNLGGFLIYHAPELKVFVDDRCALYGGDFLQAYDAARRHDPARLDQWQGQYGFRHALVTPNTPFDRHLSDSATWQEITRTPAGVLYRCETQLHSANAAATRHAPDWVSRASN